MSRAILDLREPASAQKLAVPQPAALLDAARATWRARMVNEHGSAHVFDALADQLAEAGVGVAEVLACRGFASEERRHGVLCGAVVESLGGEAYAEIEAPLPVPRHEDVDRLEAVLRNLLSVSCIAETVAVALIGAERLEMPDGPLREVLTGIWADEIGHARFGWQLVHAEVPSLPAAARERLGDYLVVAFAHAEEHELEHLPLQPAPAGGEALGLCSGYEARALFYETITSVVVPGLEAVGLPAKRAWAERHSFRASMRRSA